MNKREVSTNIWGVLNVGGHTIDELLINLLPSVTSPNGKRGVRVSDLAANVARHSIPQFVKKEEGVEFVMGSLHDLFGFTEPTAASVFLNEKFVSEKGLQLCKSIDAFYVRIIHIHQFDDEDINVGMLPIGAHPEIMIKFTIFVIAKEMNDLWLFSRYAGPEALFSPDSLWVFRRKK